MKNHLHCCRTAWSMAGTAFIQTTGDEQGCFVRSREDHTVKMWRFSRSKHFFFSFFSSPLQFFHESVKYFPSLALRWKLHNAEWVNLACKLGGRQTIIPYSTEIKTAPRGFFFQIKLRHSTLSFSIDFTNPLDWSYFPQNKIDVIFPKIEIKTGLDFGTTRYN